MLLFIDPTNGDQKVVLIRHKEFASRADQPLPLPLALTLFPNNVIVDGHFFVGEYDLPEELQTPSIYDGGSEAVGLFSRCLMDAGFEAELGAKSFAAAVFKIFRLTGYDDADVRRLVRDTQGDLWWLHFKAPSSIEITAVETQFVLSEDSGYSLDQMRAQLRVDYEQKLSILNTITRPLVSIDFHDIATALLARLTHNTKRTHNAD